MKKIVAVLWHNSANRLNMVLPEVSTFVNLKVYSAAALSDGRQDMDLLYKDLEDADLFLFNITSSDSAWDEIEEHVKRYETPVIYIGSEAISRIKTAEQMSHSAKCNQYYTYNGKENFINMMKSS